MTVAKLAVLGNPVAHSRSPDIHQQFGEMTGISLDYTRLLVPTGDFDVVAREFMNEGTGFNITVPCKREAWEFVDRASARANQAQAVNTVSRDSHGMLVGDNTDGQGMIRDIRDNLGWKIRQQRILVVGAGGAVNGVMADLLDEQPEVVHLYNRTTEKATLLADRFAGSQLFAVGLNDLEAGYDLVINGTSAGLSEQDIGLPGHVISEDSRCYDMIYGAGTTHFNQWCLSQAACTVADGLGMLVEQAALAFEIWFGESVETADVIRSLRSN